MKLLSLLLLLLLLLLSVFFRRSFTRRVQREPMTMTGMEPHGIDTK